MKADISVDAQEIAHFSRLAGEWWDEKGKFRPLHQINPLRLSYIRAQVAAHFSRDAGSFEPLSGLTAVDIGCGGGLICEPLSRMGAHVIGVDASEKNIAVATLHAERMKLAIDYRATTAEALAAQGARFDIVLALEVIEHVADVPAFVSSLAALLAPGGLLVLSTLNRTAKSFMLAIVGAEYVLRWIPRGTHDWNKFLKPSEVAKELRKHQLGILNMQGMVFNPLAREWSLNEHDVEVNYLLTAARAG